ncbi:polysaccharide deacetylase family protein [Bradyrhizobium sp. CCBAU 53338]|nr:polysaccharide deacetylase family protein [Bradyrhizobium sp. CCBAU 53338]
MRMLISSYGMDGAMRAEPTIPRTKPFDNCKSRTDLSCGTDVAAEEQVPAGSTTERRSFGEAALSIDVEDWFHAANLNIAREAWDRCELRVERNTMRLVEILGGCNVRATFFVLGWVAEKCPQLVRAIAAAGHEVASHGYNHELVYSLNPADFRTDVIRSKKYLEDLTGRRVRGYRAPSFSITEWAVPILQDAGFDYDSSVVPTIAHHRYGRLKGMDAGRPVVLLREGFYEVCISCIRLGRHGIPWGGGGYFRLAPYLLWLWGVRRILQSGTPYIFYIHPWEIDPGQPRVTGIKATHAFRHRVNLEKCEQRFASLVGAHEWMPLCDLVDGWSAGLEAPAASRVNTVAAAIPLSIGSDGRQVRAST